MFLELLKEERRKLAKEREERQLGEEKENKKK